MLKDFIRLILHIVVLAVIIAAVGILIPVILIFLFVYSLLGHRPVPSIFLKFPHRGFSRVHQEPPRRRPASNDTVDIECTVLPNEDSGPENRP